MSQHVLYLAATGHGFGHAVRSASVAAAAKRIYPDLLIILVTTAPRWLLESYLHEDFIYRPRAFDVGVIQSDSFKMDKAATLEKMQLIQARQKTIIAGEIQFLRNNNVGLVLADIPPLAAPMARAAGIPCWMMSNFGWDFIYRNWGGEFIPLADWIAQCYRQCDWLFRLPMAEPMSAFPKITDVGLTGGIPRYSETQLRSDFGIKTPKEQTILLTFGGLGLEQIPYQNLGKFPGWQFITFDRNAPQKSAGASSGSRFEQAQLPNLLKINSPYYRPVDFMPLCGRVVSKPGFSTFSEAMRLNLPIVSLMREDFAESALLLAGIQDYAEHQILTAEEFFLGDWAFLHQSPQPPRQSASLAKNGTEAIAKAIVDYFQTV